MGAVLAPRDRRAQLGHVRAQRLPWAVPARVPMSLTWANTTSKSGLKGVLKPISNGTKGL